MIYKTNNSDAPSYFLNIILGEIYTQGITCWLAGGCIRDYFMGVKPIDYDVYFPNENEFNKAKSYLNSVNAKIDWESDNGIKFYYNGIVLDLVKIFSNNPEDTISRFDYTVCMLAVDHNTLYFGENTLKDLEDRKLVINTITNPKSSLKRALKYYNKGFTMSALEASKLYDVIKDMPKQDGEDFLNFASSGETNPQPNQLPNTHTDTPENTPENTSGNTPKNNQLAPPSKKDYTFVVVIALVGLALLFTSKSKE